jgi:glycosyltransferase involved in cell wall biosynthesis
MVSVVMLGARMHFAVPQILANAGLLQTLYTDGYLGNKAWLKRLLGLLPDAARSGLVQQLSGRSADQIPSDRIVSFDLLGLWYYYKRRRIQAGLESATLFARMNRIFGNRVCRRGFDGSNVVWGFNGASLEIFQYARRHGIRCILEQAIAPRSIELELLSEEAMTWPAWQRNDEGAPFSDSDPLSQREEAEWHLADTIVCGSDFVADGLRKRNVPSEKLRVVPYGVNTSYFHESSSQSPGGTLNVLFVGEVGLRKGIPYLLEALRTLNRPLSIRAKLAGQINLSLERLREYGEWCEFLGPVPRLRMIELYGWADVLVLPSLCEGSATATYEAMACGLPIITTPNSGSLVRDGVEGFVVPIRDPVALQQKITLLADNESLRTSMAGAARERAREGSWEAYSKRLLETLALGSCESIQ